MSFFQRGFSVFSQVQNWTDHQLLGIQQIKFHNTYNNSLSRGKSKNEKRSMKRTCIVLLNWKGVG